MSPILIRRHQHRRRMRLLPRLFTTALPMTIITICFIQAISAFSPHRNNRQHHPAQPLSMLATTTTPPPPPPLPNFCADCGSSDMELKIPPGDERLRACCNACGRIEYSNPKIVVSCVIFATSDINSSSSIQCLLAQRAIEPAKGLWGIPQGFMEHGETSRQAAVREVYEETGVILSVDELSLRGVYNVPGSVQILYQATIPGGVDVLEQQLKDATSTIESTQVKLFPLNELPRDEICFSTVHWALDHCIELIHDNDDVKTKVHQKYKLYNVDLDEWVETEEVDAFP